MVLTFKIGYDDFRRSWYLPGRSLRFCITELVVISDTGYMYEAKGKSIREMRIELAAFLYELKLKTKDKSFYWYGHYCTTEHLILESLLPKDIDPPVVIDFSDELNEYAASLPDDSFGLTSDYLLYIHKLPQRPYSISEKVEMLTTHTDYPILDRTNAYSYAKWIMEALNFPTFKTWKIGVGFLKDINKERYGKQQNIVGGK